MYVCLDLIKSAEQSARLAYNLQALCTGHRTRKEFQSQPHVAIELCADNHNFQSEQNQHCSEFSLAAIEFEHGEIIQRPCTLLSWPYFLLIHLWKVKNFIRISVSFLTPSFKIRLTLQYNIIHYMGAFCISSVMPATIQCQFSRKLRKKRDRISSPFFSILKSDRSSTEHSSYVSFNSRQISAQLKKFNFSEEASHLRVHVV